MVNPLPHWSHPSKCIVGSTPFDARQYSPRSEAFFAMNVEEVAKWLAMVGMEMYTEVLRAKGVNGGRLVAMAANCDELMVSAHVMSHIFHHSSLPTITCTLLHILAHCYTTVHWNS